MKGAANRPHPAAAIHSAASAAGSLARRGAAAAPVGAPLPPPITSCLWVGPSLLFTDADGVGLLGWDGSEHRVAAAGVGGRASQSFPLQLNSSSV